MKTAAVMKNIGEKAGAVWIFYRIILAAQSKVGRAPGVGGTEFGEGERAASSGRKNDSGIQTGKI